MKPNNYAVQAERARELFLGYEQSGLIAKRGLEFDEEFIYIDFFRERHSIDRHTGRILRESGLEAGFNAVMSIYDAVCYSKPEAMLSGEWKTLHSLSPHSNFSSSEMLGTPFEDMEKLSTACIKLHGRKATKADVGYEFDAFSFLPVIFQFWEGDDEFPSRLNILFDAKTLDFIHFETAWYVADYLINSLKKLYNRDSPKE